MAIKFNRIISVLIPLFFTITASSQQQNEFCYAQFTSVQTNWLKNFQQSGLKNLARNKNTTFVPIKAHIVGTNAGVGYYPLSHLLDAICNINQDFASTGLRFYLKGDVNYVNNSELFNFNFDNYWQFTNPLMDLQAVNIFFVNATPGFCGVYIGGDDIIVIKNDCQRPGGNTLTHELGHFFSLPHTFSGWEGGQAPPLQYREKKDKSNCTFAGDGFCDTEPDYVSTRWNCPTGPLLVDPNGIPFRPDGSLYMSYSNDECMTRFSLEQQSTMIANQQMRGNSGTPVPIDTPSVVTLVSPADSLDKASTQLLFSWNKVDGASFYELQVVNINGFSIPLYDFPVQDTFFNLSGLPEFRPLQWRVRAVKSGLTCAPYSETRLFTTGAIKTSLQKTSSIHSKMDFPNPLKLNHPVLLPQDVSIVITDMHGRTVQISNHVWYPQKSGMYILYMKGIDESLLIKKLLITE